MPNDMNASAVQLKETEIFCSLSEGIAPIGHLGTGTLAGHGEHFSYCKAHDKASDKKNKCINATLTLSREIKTVGTTQHGAHQTCHQNMFVVLF